MKLETTASIALKEVLQMKAADGHPNGSLQRARTIAVFLCLVLLSRSELGLWASPQEQEKESSPETAAKLTSEQLDSLVAPIALYPDPLLSQTLVASTYPLEIIQLQQWLAQNKKLKEKELAEAVKKQDWDPSIQTMAALPDVVKQLAENIKWTTDLGNAFLAQQSGVMDAVQRMRAKAKDKGNLKSTEQQKVETKTVESKQVIVIEQANPEVIYVPTYNPTVVYGAPVYPYPAVYYPPAGYYAAGMAISFGVGMAMGAAWGGGWGYGCGWGGNNEITVNRNNSFVNNSSRNLQGGNRSNWQHNPQHRGGAPYSDRATANRYGGSARGESLQSRQATAQSRQQGSMDRFGGSQGGGASRASSGDAGRASSRDASRASSRESLNSMDRGGSRGDGGAFGGGGSGFSGSSARASSARGSSSTRSRGGGGRRR